MAQIVGTVHHRPSGGLAEPKETVRMTRLRDVRAISFDADDTLWDFERVMRHSLKCVLEELVRLRPKVRERLSIEEMIAIREEVGEELKGKVVNLEKVRLAAFRETLTRIGMPDEALADHLNGIYLRHRFEDVELYDDVLGTLDALQGKYVVGILSNGNSYPEKCGLGGRFRFVVFAQDHGVAKPDPRLFHIAVDRAGCDPRSFLHVGDSLEDDVEGANMAGVRSVWLNRGRSPNETGIRPDFEINALSELPDLVD